MNERPAAPRLGPLVLLPILDDLLGGHTGLVLRVLALPTVVLPGTRRRRIAARSWPGPAPTAATPTPAQLPANASELECEFDPRINDAVEQCPAAARPPPQLCDGLHQGGRNLQQWWRGWGWRHLADDFDLERHGNVLDRIQHDGYLVGGQLARGVSAGGRASGASPAVATAAATSAAAPAAAATASSR